MRAQAVLPRGAFNAEGRRSKRRPVSLSTFISVGNDTYLPAVIRDLSTSGALLELRADGLCDGDKILVSLPSGPITATVVWVGGAFVGCEFGRTVSRGTVSTALLAANTPRQTAGRSLHAVPTVRGSQTKPRYAERERKLRWVGFVLAALLWAMIGLTAKIVAG